MPVSSRTPKRRPRSRTAGVASGVLLLASALAGCSGESPPEQPAAETGPTVESTLLADYDTSDLALTRAAFCGGVDDEAIITALGAAPRGTESWQPGRRLPDSQDISNEFGCSWSTASVTARAWVFAPPITQERAADFVGEVVGMKCRRLKDAPVLGDPGVTRRCGLNTGATLTGISGLVGDAWVGCEITHSPLSSTSAAGSDETARVGEWCVAVLEALRAT